MVKLCILQAGEFSPEMDASIPRYEPLYRNLFSPFDDYELTFFRCVMIFSRKALPIMMHS